MASMITSFGYTLSLILIVNNTPYTIPSSSINSIVLNHEYDRNNMPIIYLGVRLSTDVYNRMVLNADKAVVNFRLFKYDNESPSRINTPYIEDTFLYVMSSNPNYNETFDQYISGSTLTNTSTSDSYLDGYIGLISLRCVEDNKKLFNDILKDTNPLSIVHRYTNHMNMCIEPFDNVDHIDQFIIPPITSITKLIKYLDDNFTLYNSGYRFFRDFNVTYLLSMKGNPVKENNNRYNTIIISIQDPLDNLSNVQSMEINKSQQAYILYVNAKDTSLQIDRLTDKTYNSIIGVDSEGNVAEEDMDLPSYTDSSKKVLLEKVPGNNLQKIHSTKRMIESKTVVIHISKTEVDSSLLTPNKEYQIKNYNSNRDYDGKYVLSYKKEVLYKQDTDYVGSVMFGLRKVLEE